MTRILSIFVCVGLLTAIGGCGGSDKAKNKDKDVPEPPKAQLAK